MKMPEYVVLKDFADLQDNKHFYRTGDSFPRTGVEVSEERVAELSSANNKCRQPLIAKVEVEIINDSKPEVVAEEKPKKNKKKEK